MDVGIITLNGHLKVGSAHQEVVVTADTAALLQTESGEQSTTLDEKTIGGTTVGGRNMQISGRLTF